MAYTPPESMPGEEETYLQEIQEQDIRRHNYFKELVAQKDVFKTQVKRLKLDLSDQTDSRIRYQEQVEVLRKRMAEYQNTIDKNAYVAVLIDGDGAIFLDSFLERPAQGANEASQRLRQHVKNHLKSSGGKHDLPIYARVYANLDNLANHIEKSGVVEDKNMVSRFSTHFTNSCAEFEFVNVGPGKENADCKMRKMLEFYYDDARCKRIYFVGCHDGGYSHVLKNYLDTLREPKSRIVLVETTPALPLFKRMGFEILRFDNVFRNGPLLVETNSFSENPTRVVEWRTLVSDGSKSPNEAITPPGTPLIDLESPKIDVKTSGNGGTSITYSPSSYATAGAKGGFQNVNLSKPKKVEVKAIQFNKDGYRIDPIVQVPSDDTKASYRQKHDKISSDGFCNSWYLSGACSHGQECKREHKLKLNANELEYHRFMARTSACKKGRDCDDFYCSHGHHCPDSPNCTRGQSCRFRHPKVPRVENWDWHYYDKDSMTIMKIWNKGDIDPRPKKTWNEGEPDSDNNES